MFSLQGRTALITGATGHLGQAMTLALAAAGAHVLVNGRNPARVAALVDKLRSQGATATPAVFDVTDGESVAAHLLPLSQAPIHIVVNNASAGTGGTIETSSAKQYVDSFGIGVVAAHNIVRAALPALRLAVAQTGDASVINIASMYGVVSPDLRLYDSARGSNPPFYGATKAALIQWTRYAACEFGADGIRVNSISPGPFPSPQVQASAPDFVERLTQKVPMRRIGAPDEMAGPVVFLASPAASFVNGANLMVDGGWSAW